MIIIIVCIACMKKHIEKSNTYRKYIDKSVDFFYIEIIIFLWKNAINTFYNLYYDNKDQAL